MHRAKDRTAVPSISKISKLIGLGLGVGSWELAMCLWVPANHGETGIHPPRAQRLHHEQPPRHFWWILWNAYRLSPRGQQHRPRTSNLPASIPEIKRGLTKKICCCWEQGSSANFTRTDECLPSFGGRRTTAFLCGWGQENPADLMSPSRMYDKASGECCVPLRCQTIDCVKRKTKCRVSS